MKFTTPVPVPASPVRITYQDNIVVAGSCFAGEIGDWFRSHRFNVCINPFGILFNPVSLATSIGRMIEGCLYEPEELVEHGGLWHSMDHHGSFSSASVQETTDRINDEFLHGRESILKAKWLIVTFGTAWVYDMKGKTVANCHKMPSAWFGRKLISHDLIVGQWLDLAGKLRSVNPELNIIFSVSPVRYLKHGAVGNQLSKSHLLIAVNQLNELGVGSYFPAYEIMMDELRDYRFWDRDMAHPSDMAVEYILGQFRSAWLSPESAALSEKMEPWLLMLQHRPLHETPEQTVIRVDRAEREIAAILSVGK